MSWNFNSFSRDMLNHLLPGQQTMQDSLTATETETVTSGACAVYTPVTYISTTGTAAYTLADGPAGKAGPTKRFVCAVAASTPIGTLTPTTTDTTAGMVCPTTFVFNTVGQEVVLQWTGSAWRCLETKRAGVVIPVLGTTVLTGYNLNHVYSCSVTGTVVSATTKGVPNGAYAGDFCVVACSTAASTPIGSITFAGLSLANVALTDLQAIGATTDTVTLSWNGTAWLVIANSGITLA